MKPKRILVVEDESLVRALMVEVLVEAGFDVDQAGTADEAHGKLLRDGYGLIVTDIHTPGTLDGIELARRVNSMDPGVPILIVTARPDVLDHVNIGDIQAHAMQKPFSFRTLVDVARRLTDDD